MVKRKKARSTLKEAAWSPWGLFDHKTIPELPEQVVQATIDQLKVTDDVKKEEVRERLRELAVRYWAIRRDVQKPRREWYRKKITPIRTAVEKLLKLVQEPPEGSLSGLAFLTEMRMKRPLRRQPMSKAESVEELLEAFKKVCDVAVRRRGTPGARKQQHLKATVKSIDSLWRDFTGKPVALSLDTEVGASETEFIYPGPRFVHLILKAIDPTLDLAQVATALRNALGAPRVENSAET